MEEPFGTREVPGGWVPPAAPEPDRPRPTLPEPGVPQLPPRLPPRTEPVPALVPPMATPPPAAAWPGADPDVVIAGAAARRAELDRARRRRGLIVLGVVAVLIVCGGAALALVIRSHVAERRFPAVAEIEPIRSVVIRATYENEGVSTDTIMHIDAAGDTFYWDEQGPVSYDFVTIEDRWFFEVDGAWVRDVPTRDTRDFVEEMLLVADGLSIDEALPSEMRDYLEVSEVARETVSGRDTRHFTMVLDHRSFERSAPDLYERFVMVWGEPVGDEPGAGQTGVAVDGTNLELWVDDDGWVWRIASQGDAADGGGFDQTTVAWSSAPFTYPEPAEGAPVAPPVTGSGG